MTGEITAVIHAHHKPSRTPYQARPPAAIAVAAMKPAVATCRCMIYAMIAGLTSFNRCGVTPFSVSTPSSNPVLENARKKKVP